MNVVKEIQRINQIELDAGGNGATGSWHDEYKDSAYIFVGGLPDGMTEGDLITICSQYGEIVDVNMPRDKDTGKAKGFGFVMYEDQRSTILAVDNLNGGKVVDRTLRVDHVKNYKQPKVETTEGERVDREEPSMNAKPLLVRDGVSDDDGSVSTAPSIDPEDPMAAYLLSKRKEDRAAKKTKKRKHEDETPEERRARKERKKAKKEAKARALEGEGSSKDRRRIDVDVKMRSVTPPRRRERSDTPPRRRNPDDASPRRREEEGYRRGGSREERHRSERGERDDRRGGSDRDRERHRPRSRSPLDRRRDDRSRHDDRSLRR